MRSKPWPIATRAPSEKTSRTNVRKSKGCQIVNEAIIGNRRCCAWCGRANAGMRSVASRAFRRISSTSTHNASSNRSWPPNAGKCDAPSSQGLSKKVILLRRHRRAFRSTLAHGRCSESRKRKGFFRDSGRSHAATRWRSGLLYGVLPEYGLRREAKIRPDRSRTRCTDSSLN